MKKIALLLVCLTQLTHNSTPPPTPVPESANSDTKQKQENEIIAQGFLNRRTHKGHISQLTFKTEPLKNYGFVSSSVRKRCFTIGAPWWPIPYENRTYESGFCIDAGIKKLLPKRDVTVLAMQRVFNEIEKDLRQHGPVKFTLFDDGTLNFTPKRWRR